MHEFHYRLCQLDSALAASLGKLTEPANVIETDPEDSFGPWGPWA